MSIEKSSLGPTPPQWPELLKDEIEPKNQMYAYRLRKEELIFYMSLAAALLTGGHFKNEADRALRILKAKEDLESHFPMNGKAVLNYNTVSKAEEVKVVSIQKDIDNPDFFFLDVNLPRIERLTGLPRKIVDERKLELGSGTVDEGDYVEALSHFFRIMGGDFSEAQGQLIEDIKRGKVVGSGSSSQVTQVSLMQTVTMKSSDGMSRAKIVISVPAYFQNDTSNRPIYSNFLKFIPSLKSRVEAFPVIDLGATSERLLDLRKQIKERIDKAVEPDYPFDATMTNY